MEIKQLTLLRQTLDDIRHENGTEYWLASELLPLLGYKDKKNSETPINRAKEACTNSGGDININFQDIKQGTDLQLTRLACYLIALNGNPKKEEIAFAQAYFVTRTREIEVLQVRMEEFERLSAREKLKITEKEFATMVVARGVTEGRDIGVIKSSGDKELFGGPTTVDMKKKLNIDPKRPLADFLPPVTLKAKDLATAMTTENSRSKNLQGKFLILGEHIKNNKNVRRALTDSGIYPEKLPAAEDIKKIEIRHRKQKKELEERQKQELEEATKKLHSQ